MKRIHHLIFILTIVLLAGCDKDDIGLVDVGDEISFVTRLPGLTTRANYNIEENIDTLGITVSGINTEGANGALGTHFEGKVVEREIDGIFRSGECRWPSNARNNTGYLKIFAFHPTIAEMNKRGGFGNQYFKFANYSKKDNSGITYDYRLTKFRVIPDISRQVDFVTSITEGNKNDNLYSGVELTFEHQLCGVEIAVWGNNSLYDVEIAGVRIGGTVVEADFSLSTEIANPANNENTIGAWLINNNSPRGHVDYVFAPGDKVVNVNINEHNTKDSAASIMGTGGKAMVIPYKHQKWVHDLDKGNSGKGLYFSALIRMYEHDGDHHLIYPSSDPATRPYLVYLVVRQSDGMVMKRLTSAEYDSYTAPAGQEKRIYGWAAAPANADWKPGYLYSYVLDYSNGVGVHDPDDLNPGGPIVDYGGVEITTNDTEWGEGGTIGNKGWGANSNDTGPDGTVWWK